MFLLLLGDKESGKTTLIAKLQGNEDPKKGSGLEYGYIDVRDEYRDGKNRYRTCLVSCLPTSLTLGEVLGLNTETFCWVK